MESFFKYIKRNYGHPTKQNMQSLLNNYRALATIENQAFFLQKCIRNGVTPKSFNFNLGFLVRDMNRKTATNMLSKVKSLALRTRTKCLYSKAAHIASQNDKLLRSIEQLIPVDLFDDFVITLQRAYESRFSLTKRKLIDKYQKILASEYETYRQRMRNHKNWFINLTETHVPENVANVLALGNKYAAPSKLEDSHIVETISQIEASMHHLDPDDKNQTRNKVVNIITNAVKQSSSAQRLSLMFLGNDINATKKFIRENTTLIVSRADKGNTTVLAERIDYVNKMNELLNDHTTYEEVNYNRTYKGAPVQLNLVIQRKVNTYISKLENLGYLSKGEGFHLRTHNSTLGRAYGAYKIHKGGQPLRPIISCVNTATYKLARWFTDIIQKILGQSDRHVQNSIDFKDSLTDSYITRNQKLLSLDVKSLFTNIPLDLIIAVIAEKWNRLKQHTKMPLELFIEGITLIYDNCYFTFNDKTYHQIHGTPMGSPASPAMADLVMEMIEEKVINELSNKGITLWDYKRYVDDTFMRVNSRHINTIVNTFNAQHPRLQFTFEEEREGTLPFLDVQVIRNEDGKLSTQWYTKPTWSGRYLSYESQMPTNYKRNTVSLLTRKVIELSDAKYHEDDLRKVNTTLQMNDYPIKFIKDVMSATINKINDPTPGGNDLLMENKFVAIPYIPEVFHKLKRTLNEVGIKAVGKAAKPLSCLSTQLKDKIPKQFLSNVCYELTCDCGKNYIGQTKQFILDRVKQHIKGGNQQSAMSAHLKDDNCSLSFDNVRILCQEQNRKVREVKEAILIKKKKTAINTQSDDFDIGHCYDNIVQMLKTSPTHP